MFDRIGSTDDPDAPRRSAASLGITVGMGVAAIGFWTAWAAFVFVAPAPPAPDEVPIDLVRLDVPDEVPLPAAPAAAAPAARKGEAAPETPSDEPAEPQPLPDDPPDEVASTSGTPDGVPKGTGAIPGTGTDPRGAGGPGKGGGGGAPTVHSTALVWKSRPAPSWPAAATTMGVTEATCTATVEFDARGIATTVTFAECPGVFQRGARSAILRSRVEPFEAGGKTSSVRTTIRIRYLLEE